MQSTVKMSKERWIMPYFSQTRSAYLKKAAKKISAKLIFFSVIRPIFYVVSKKVIFTTVRSIHLPKHGFKVSSLQAYTAYHHHWLMKIPAWRYYSASVNYFTREPCKFGNRKKSRTTGYQLLSQLKIRSLGQININH